MDSIRKSSLKIRIIFIAIILIIVGSSFGIIYVTVVKDRKSFLEDLSINQQNIIQSIYRETTDKKETLEILKQFFENNPSFGKTGEFLIATLENDSIRYLVEVRNPPFPGFTSIHSGTEMSAPMRFALNRNTGTITGPDYRNVKVLAYCTFLPELGWGLVTKMDFDEVLHPFYMGAFLTIFITLFLIIIGSNIFLREFNPILNKVQVSEERYRNLFEYSALPIWEVNASGIKKYFDQLTSEGIHDIDSYLSGNPDKIRNMISMIEVIAVNRRSLLKNTDSLTDDARSTLLQHFNDNTNDVFKKVFLDLYNGITRTEAEIEFLSDGKTINYQAQVSVLPFHEKDLSVVLISFINITVHREYERKLLENENRLKKSQEMAHLGSWKLDLLINKLQWTEEVFRIFGFLHEDENVTYERFLNAVHPDDREKVNNAYFHSLNNNLPGYDIEHRIIRESTGEIRYVHEKCDHYRNEKGQAIASIGMVIDITDWKKAETELNESKQKLSMALENGKIGIWEWNPMSDVLILDPKTEEIFDLTPDSYVPSFSAMESIVHEDDLRHLKIEIRNTLKKDVPLETVFRIVSKDGSIKYIILRAVTYRDNVGNPTLLTGIAFDLTDFQERTEILVSRLNEELLRSNKELEQFAYIASHDLQEPLRMVTSFTQLLSLRYGDKLDAEAKEYIDFAVNGAKRMYDLLNDLLSYSRINTRGAPFDRINLSDLLEITKQNLSVKIKERKAIINSQKLPTVYADRNQMIQILQNLISNSIKFSNGRPRIFLYSKSEKNQHIIAVKDEGIGIEPVYYDRIFKIFQRLNDRDKYDGTGIGLSICKRIVERHGGNIWVESSPGKGSTFFFTVPRQTHKVK